MNIIVSKKSISRLAAVQAIYQYEINSRSQSIEELVETIRDFYNNIESEFATDSAPIKLQVNFLQTLIKYVVDNINEIDQLIGKHLNSGWAVDRIDLTLLSILRVGICELKYFPETPYKVIINEFTNIASDLLKSKDVGFVNSILDNINNNIRNL